MNFDRDKQKGFSLIEAIIAFLVLSIGLLGAALFHSTILKESAISKEQAFALKLAEERIEELRAYKDLDEYENTISSFSVASNPVATVVGSTATYSIDNFFYDESGISSAAIADINNAQIVVSWQDNEGESASIAVSTFIAWLDPLDSLSIDEAGIGDGSAGVGIQIPTGTAIALDRTSVAIGTDPGIEAGVIENPSDANDTKVYIKDDGGTVYQVLDRGSSSDDYFTIVGTIVNNPGDDLSSSKAELTYLSELQNGNVGRIVDVGITGGGNCLIYSIDPADVPKWAHYACVVGEGWNGYISLEYNPPPAETGPDSGSDINDDASVCMAYLRRYKYNIIAPSDAGNFRVTDDPSTSEYTIVGESGLIRFGNGAGETPLSNYFWRHPQLIESNDVYPPWGTLEVGDVQGQSFIISNNKNFDCSSYTNTIFDAVSSAYQAAVFPDGRRVASTSAPTLEFWPGGFNDVNNEVYNTSGSSGDNDYRGEVVLGYVVAYTSIQGSLYPFDPNTASTGDYSIETSIQEPSFNQSCEIFATDNPAEYTYECSVPTGFGAAVIASSADTSLFGCPDEDNGLDVNDFGISGASLANIAFRLFSADMVSVAGLGGEDFRFASSASCSP